jgi:ApaG protein
MPDHFDVLWTRIPMYQAVTRNIAVTVSARFMVDRSASDDNLYHWVYTVEIRNRGDTTVQLKTRHWIITDGVGKREEVRGPGVVGEQPVLEPGAAFEYTSRVPLPTPSGFMTGTYGMVTMEGERFDIEIPAFSLDSPEAKRTIN